MKKQFILILIILILYPMAINADLVLSDKDQKEIKEILNKPVNSYQLDIKKKADIFKKIDAWIGQQGDWSGKGVKQIKRDEYLLRRLVTRKNSPILPGADMPDGIVPKVPFGMIALQSDAKRIFYKELTIPTSKKMANDKVEERGRTFIERNGFCLQTEIDKIMRTRFLLLQRQKIMEQGVQPRAKTLSQEVIFVREIDGLEVFNSKQVVSVHPDSEEILAYRSLNWTPIDNDSAKIPAYFDFKEVIEKIKKAYEKSPYTFEIKKIQLGLYQAKNIIFPALKICVNPIIEENANKPPLKNLVISLAKDLNIDFGESDPKSRIEKSP